MAFLHTKLQLKRFTDINLLHQLQCKVCPLYNLPNLHKDIKPYGYGGPDGLYVLGLGPGQEEDRTNKFFVGTSGSYLKSCFTEEQIKYIRFNNIVRTRPPEDNPQFEAIEACRPSIEQDIVAVKPKLVFILGGFPLQWTLKTEWQPSINAWRGHRFPFRIGKHVMWGWPIFHPAYITRNMYLDEVFKLDIRNAYDFLERGLEPIVVDPKHALDNCIALYKLDEILEALHEFSQEPEVSIDLETHDDTKVGRPYALGARELTKSIGTKKKAIAFPWNHPQYQWHPEDFKKIRAAWHAILRNKKQRKDAHNAPFEMEWEIVEYNDPLIATANWRDTMNQAYCLGYGGNVKEGGSSDKSEKLFKGLLSLDNLCRVYFGFWLKAISNVDRANIIKEDLHKVLVYNAGDTKWDHWLAEEAQKDVVYHGLESIVEEHDRRLPALVLAQWQGLNISVDRAKAHSTKIGDELTKIFSNITNHPSVIEYQTKYNTFNIGAPADVSYLFRYLGYKVTRPDPKDKNKEKLSSDDEILKAIDHPLARWILEYRELAKLKSTYADVFIPGTPNCVVYPDGKLHTQYTSTFTSTGRTSSQGPNVQNLPKRKHKEIRDIIIAPEGYVMTSTDFGQIEYRAIVMTCKDPKLIDYVWDDRDIHGEWALKIALKYPKRVGLELAKRWKNSDSAQLKKTDKLFKQWRDIVKNAFVFANLYGAGFKKLAVGLNIPMEVAQELQKAFWKEFDGAKAWHEASYKFYHRHGYVESMTGARRYAPLQAGEIINSSIQRVASDIVIDGMNRLVEYAFKTGKHYFLPIYNVHDDVGHYLPKSSWEEDLNTIIKILLDCRYPFINVPLSVESSFGSDWHNQKEYGTFNNAEELKARLDAKTGNSQAY